MADWRHLTHVFAYKGKPVARMLNSSWCRVRKNLGLRQVRVHDLKHTFGRRLRAAGVNFEERQANKLPFQSNPFAQKFELIPLGAD